MINLKPKRIKKINTKNRRISGFFPTKEALNTMRQIQKYQNSDIMSQQPVLWDRAKNFNIYDTNNNCWIDFSSTIFVANSGHANPRIVKAIKNSADKLLHAYSYPTIERARYLKKLIKFLPSYLQKACLLNSGTEASERAIKIARLYGKQYGKKIIVGHLGNYHGKTLGAAMLSGNKNDCDWVGYKDPNIFRLKFPYPWSLSKKISGKKLFFDDLKILKAKQKTQKICAFFLETYQGWGAIFYPKDYVTELEKWCKKNNVLLIFDEIQSGFGRTGKLFGYQHYSVKPDLVVCGKGISSSLPLSAVFGSSKLLDLDTNYTSTHGGHPLCCIAGEANLDEIKKRNLIKKSNELGKILFKEVKRWQNEFGGLIPYIEGRGLVCGVFFAKAGNKNQFNIELCNLIVENCLKNGVFNIKTNRGTLKIAPPLTITKSALLEGLSVIYDTIKEII
jgi:4-aminobutyrate aminotransferase/(S)-3-amino-2-methylpropionate transaminase